MRWRKRIRTIGPDDCRAHWARDPERYGLPPLPQDVIDALDRGESPAALTQDEPPIEWRPESIAAWRAHQTAGK